MELKKDLKIINLKKFLDQKVKEYNRPYFIKDDPISIPHLFSKKQDIEIIGFITAMLAWGQRKTIIKKCNELINYMDNAPYQFITQHKEKELEKIKGFKHRTFNETDMLYFIHFFKSYYSQYNSLETAFAENIKGQPTIEKGLIHFHHLFFSLELFPHRTKKHISTPEKKSACKRLNMFLRWMVRKDKQGVDFGIWKTISPSQLICPCDVHVERVARKLGLIQRKQMDWLTALELTQNLKKMDSTDPVKYDFALFGLGVEKEF